MKAARLHAYGQPLQIDEIPTPTPGPGQVLVAVHGAGFCHSDIHVIDGDLPILPRMPLVLGHENAGVVAATGAGVEAVREGDAVAVFGGWGCGRCRLCVTGHEQLCETPAWAGLSTNDGGYAEYLLVPHERYLVPLSSSGHGVCAAFDFVGTDATLDLAIRSTRTLGKVSQVGLAGGTARLKVLDTSRFEVLFEATLWGSIKELQEVIALAESGRLATIPIETAPLDAINDVYRRLKAGEIAGRAVITPAG
jgi:propanol-preferring alcohol dehydrogenase